MTRRKFLKGATAFGVGMTFAPQLVWGAEEKKLNLYNWDTYIGENTVANFAKKIRHESTI
jgi:spermidine/putrescine transport system substrate-binding protein